MKQEIVYKNHPSTLGGGYANQHNNLGGGLTVQPNNLGGEQLNLVQLGTSANYANQSGLIILPQGAQNGRYLVIHSPEPLPTINIQYQASRNIAEKRSDTCTMITTIFFAVIMTIAGLYFAIGGGISLGWISILGFLPTIICLYLCFGPKHYHHTNKLGLCLLIVGINLGMFTIGLGVFYLVIFEFYSHGVSAIAFIPGIITVILSIGAWVTGRKEGAKTIFQNRALFLMFVVVDVLVFVAFIIFVIVYAVISLSSYKG